MTTPPQRPGAPHRGEASFPEQSHCRRRHGQALSSTSRAATPRAMALAPRQTLRPAAGVPLRTRALPPWPRTPWEPGLLHAQQLTPGPPGTLEGQPPCPQEPVLSGSRGSDGHLWPASGSRSQTLTWTCSQRLDRDE